MNDTQDSVDAKVLIVEDEEDLAELYREWLYRRFDVEIALNGQEALDHLSDDIDVVLLDRRMPGLSGDQVLGEIRDREIGCRVVIVSAVTPDFDVIAMGFDDYLEKPITREELIETVESMLNRSEYSTQLQEFHQLVSKVAVLEANKVTSELEQNEEFQALKNRIEELRVEVDQRVDAFDEADFEAAFRQFDDSDDEY